MARLIDWAVRSWLPLLGLPVAWWAGGWPELITLALLGPVLWLWSALLGWRRPTGAELAGWIRIAALSGLLSLLLRYPAASRHGAVDAVRIGGLLAVLAWAARVWLLQRTAATLAGLGPVPRWAGICAAASVLGGSTVFWLEIRQVGHLTGPHTPLEAAHLWWGYTGGLVLTLIVPIGLFAALAVYILLHPDAEQEGPQAAPPER